MAEHEKISVVLRGPMNPALHHPQWYSRVGALTENEADEALALPFQFIPQLSQFRTSTMDFTCESQRWQLGSDGNAAERVIAITETIFDRRLVETPIRAFGINVNCHLYTRTQSVSQVLAHLVASLSVGFVFAADTSARLSFSQPAGSVRLRTEIEPSMRGDELVYLAFNAHHEVGSSDRARTISIGDLLRRDSAEVMPLIERYKSMIVDAINREEIKR